MQSSAYIARFLLLGFILAVNAFFAAAEVALLSVRDSRLRHMAEEGHPGARMALALLAKPGRLLSVTQVGVTLASLGLGWAGEDTLYQMLMALFHPIVHPATLTILHGLCFVLSFAVMTYCHVVIGEVVPKNLAIEKADRLAVIVAPVLTVISRLASPFVNIIEGSSAAIARMLGVRADHHAGGHSTEELKLIVSSSRFAGHLPRTQEAMIHRVLDLEELSVREIMQPRHDVVSVPVNASLDEVLETMVSSHHSRLPVWAEAPEHMVGVVFFKDMLRLWQERRIRLRAHRPVAKFRLSHIMRRPLIVPETKPLPQMLEEFRQGHTHMALIVDEFGTVTGLVTVEDVLEQIVGAIEDEFDDKLTPPVAQADEAEVDGATSIREFASLYGIELPANAGFETVAGYMLYKLGHIPQAGEAIGFEDRRLTVLTMDRNRIATVLVEKIPAAEAASNGAAQEGKQHVGY
ncbi:MAG: hemolysin family protein [Acidobacteriota bacterium]